MTTQRAHLAAQSAGINYAGRRGILGGKTNGTSFAKGRKCTVVGYGKQLYQTTPVVLVAVDEAVTGSWRLGADVMKYLVLTADLKVLGCSPHEDRFFHVVLGIGDLTLDDGTEL